MILNRMIKNEKQYKISKKRLNELVERINATKYSGNHNSLKLKMLTAPLEGIKKEMEKEIAEYEKLKANKSIILKERSLAEVPNIIIEYKIAHNLTHKDFSKLLGIKEQQLQRYESDGFKTVSFQNLMKFINLINLDLKVKETVIKPKRKLRTAQNKSFSHA